MRADLTEAHARLRELGADRIGITGFCLGGTITYRAACWGLDLGAAAPFYGGHIATELGPRVRCSCSSAAPTSTSPKAVETVRATHPDVVLYPEAGHGFMRDGSSSYDPAAANRRLGPAPDVLRPAPSAPDGMVRPAPAVAHSRGSWSPRGALRRRHARRHRGGPAHPAGHRPDRPGHPGAPRRSVTTAPAGFEGEGFPVRRAFAGVDLAELDPFVHMDQMGEVEYAPGEPKGTPGTRTGASRPSPT